MTIAELHELLKDDLSAIRIQLATLNDQVTKVPVIEKQLADVRSTVYDPETGILNKVTLVADRQKNCKDSQAPGNRSERRGNLLAAGALLIALVTMILMIIQLGGCAIMPKTTTHLDNLDQVDTKQDYAEVKKEITAMVKTIGKDARLELTGDRTYDIEADGSIYMVHADQRRPVSLWRAGDEWQYFREDVKNNRLLQRLKDL